VSWRRRFLVRGVFWRQFLRWAVLNIPMWMEPAMIAWWSAFFLLWGPGRRGVMRNLAAIKPRSWAIANFFRVYRVFWNYAWTITDNVRHREQGTIPDWEFAGMDHFEALQSRGGGAIILTAHMGSYDLGAQMFATYSTRRIVMVRAPEVDPETRNFEESLTTDRVQITFNTEPADLALDLLSALRNGEVIAIQGDRVTEGIASVETMLFGKQTRVPSGPFALAMVARAPIYPLFVIRRGRRAYQLLTCPPIEVVRTSANRHDDIACAVEQWSRALETTLREAWHQWFAFEPFYEEQAA
jgi:lauroyl/myristoyl acyltransferase